MLHEVKDAVHTIKEAVHQTGKAVHGIVGAMFAALLMPLLRREAMSLASAAMQRVE